MAQANVDAVAALTLKVRIADLKGEVATIRSFFVRLFERRGGIRMRIVSDERGFVGKRDADACCAGKAGKRTIDEANGRVAVVFDAPAELKPNMLEINPLKPEDSERILFRRR